MDENKVAKTFEDLGVEPRLLKAIGEMGFESPMPIQEMVIPHLLEKMGMWSVSPRPVPERRLHSVCRCSSV